MSEDVAEIEELAKSAGYEIAYEIIQRRARPDPTTFLGKGKIREVQELLRTWKVDTLLINGNLKPSHHYILENALKVECIDRIRLVLEIFMVRADNKESRLQVERARLKYEIPLLREWIHSAKMGEHPGFLGGGEYAVDVYYDLIKRRIRRIDEELGRQGESNEQRRLQRKRKGFNLVSLAGYTNAGKSTLMRALTGEDVFVEDRMFSTLSTTTKRLDGMDLPILITDTIGFLDDLPPYVIEAFKNTVGEIFNADLILLILDASDIPMEIERKLRTSEEILFPEVELNRILLVLNKIDKLNEGEREGLLETIRKRWHGAGPIQISASTMEGIGELNETLMERFSRRNRIELRLPQTGETEALITWLRSRATILALEYANDVRVVVTCDQADVDRIQTATRALKGSMSRSEEN
ncbi:MAG TPA: GTPase HflX [Methanomassiliicoccales archaeon]|nr:GTPase HflX [Methanomassiliicoccales archaeon]